MMASNKTRGFSLLELLVVVAVIGLLAGLVIPSVRVAIDAQRRDQCKEGMERLAIGIVERARAILQSPQWSQDVWDAEPPLGDTGSSSTLGGYQAQTTVLLPPVSSSVMEDPGLLLGFSSWVSELRMKSAAYDVGPFLGTIEDMVGETAGIQLDADGRDRDPWESYLNWACDFSGSLAPERLWIPVQILSKGPNRIYESSIYPPVEHSGDDLMVSISIVPELIQETLRRIAIVNEAILRFRKDHGNVPIVSGNPIYVDRTIEFPRDNKNTVYGKLVELGYLQEPEGFPMYALDAWGYCLLSDIHALRFDSGNPGTLKALDINQPVLSVYSGNILWPRNSDNDPMYGFDPPELRKTMLEESP